MPVRRRLLNIFSEPAKATRKELRSKFPDEAPELLDTLELQISGRLQDCDFVGRHRPGNDNMAA